MSVIDRFLGYIAFDTTSNEKSDLVPSSPGQLVLSAFLADELKRLGVSDVRTEKSYVYGVIPSSAGYEDRPAIGLIAHMDTSSAVSGANIRPRRVHYEGGDIELSETVTMKESVFPNLKRYIGKDLIVTDGTTLLGGDDKAGVAEIVTAAEYLLAHPEIPHGKICIGFTPDEEIGRGPDHFDVPGFGAAYAYTVDGGTLGGIEYENFNAASCRVTFNGISIHPGSSKNKMVNAVLMANEFISLLPPAEVPAHTEGYEGFYHVDEINGDVTKTTLAMIIRDHDPMKFENRKETVKKIAAFLNDRYGEGFVEAVIRDSYRNMKEKIEPCMEIVTRAEETFRKLGVEPFTEPVRGGTDGATLSYMGLPCPNLSTGGENFHGIYEFVCIQDMETMVDVLVQLVSAEEAM